VTIDQGQATSEIIGGEKQKA